MAYIKSKNNAAPAETPVEQPEAPVEPIEAQEEAVATEAQAEPCVEKEIPEYVQYALKAFSNMEKAYVNRKGQIFSENTPKQLIGDAVLYKNPYFKS